MYQVQFVSAFDKTATLAVIDDPHPGPASESLVRVGGPRAQREGLVLLGAYLRPALETRAMGSETIASSRRRASGLSGALAALERRSNRRRKAASAATTTIMATYRAIMLLLTLYEYPRRAVHPFSPTGDAPSSLSD